MKLAKTDADAERSGAHLPLDGPELCASLRRSVGDAAADVRADLGHKERHARNRTRPLAPDTGSPNDILFHKQSLSTRDLRSHFAEAAQKIGGIQTFLRLGQRQVIVAMGQQVSPARRIPQILGAVKSGPATKARRQMPSPLLYHCFTSGPKASSNRACYRDHHADQNCRPHTPDRQWGAPKGAASQQWMRGARGSKHGGLFLFAVRFRHTRAWLLAISR